MGKILNSIRLCKLNLSPIWVKLPVHSVWGSETLLGEVLTEKVTKMENLGLYIF